MKSIMQLSLFIYTTVLRKSILFLFAMLHVTLYSYAQTPDFVDNTAQTNQLIIQNENRSVNQIDPAGNADLPLGIGSEIGGKQYIIAIDSLVLSPQGSFMRATTIIEIPLTGDKLSFMATNIAITPGGIKSSSSAKMELASDIPIRLSDKVKMTVKGTQHKTFVEFDCNGFIGMGLQGEFEFCRDFLIPELPDGSIAPDPQRVKANFETYVSDFSNVLTKVSISPFQVPGLNGFGFYVQDAWVDQSDVANPLGIIFPQSYHSPDLDPANPDMWRGFFIRELDVRLPQQFNAQANNQRRAVKGYNLIIDNMGFTGTVAGTNLIPMKEGQISGWAFSLDSMKVDIVCNNITGAGFKGSINIPITSEDVLLNYTAIVQDNDNYLFAVQSKNTVSVPLWGATMNLLPSTSITIEKRAGKFIPTANLTGNINFAVQMSGSNSSEFKGITFEQLIICGEKPYIRAGTFSIVSANSNMASFKVSIGNIGVIVADNSLGIRFSLTVNLMSTEDNGFGAMADLTVYGKMEENTDGKHKWSFDRVDLNALRIDVDQGAYEIHGMLVIYRKDPVYGNGFSGSVMARFQPGIQVNANAQFGNKNDMRYWYVDAMVSIPSGIMIMSGVGLYGFGGGMYHHMKQRNVPVSLAGAGTGGAVVPGTIAPPTSGITYVPDSTIFLGLKATVIVATYPLSKTVNADVTLEATFLEGGGMGQIMFYGSGYFMTEITERSTQAPLYCNVYIGYDFQNKILHGTFDVFVNINNTIKGINANNLAGSMVMHFEPHDWYIYAGTPEQRIGVSILGVKVGTYFMVGTQIPAMPAPPSNVSDILGGMDLDFMRDENALGNGSGFAFGASIDINTGKKQFLVFYGQFAAGIGFDIMLKNYGKDVICAGRSEPLGANGWYASGQTYVYVQGEIGISVDLIFIHGQFKILEIGAAAVLQAKLPNPVWMKGTIGGYYAILGGKVKGNCQFTLTIGEECTIVGGSVVSSIQVINETSPQSSPDAGASVFVNPQATFNIPVDKIMEMEDLDGMVKAYRVKLGHFKLLVNNTEISGTPQMNDAGDAVAFVANDILPPNTAINATVRVYFEERQNGNWIPVEFKGKQIDEVKEFSFTTGAAPDVIPLNNIAYSYPEINQSNFLKAESGTGYITLLKGQPYLFQPDTRWVTKVRFTDDAQSAALESDLSYNASDRTISYTIPAGLTDDNIYHYYIINVPSVVNAPVNSNITASTKSVTDDGSVTLESKSISGTSETVTEKELLTYDLRTSKYNTFTQKMNAFSASQGWLLPVDGYISVHEIGLTLSGDELFDVFDISGTTNTAQLIQFEADATNRWFKNEINPLIYAESPLSGSATIKWRTTVTLGLPPFKGIIIRQQADQVQVSGVAAPANSRYSAIVYKLPYYMFNDYIDLQAQCAARLSQNQVLSTKGYNIIFNPFPPIKTGKYAIKLTYVLPGKNIPTSTYQLEINNQF